MKSERLKWRRVTMPALFLFLAGVIWLLVKPAIRNTGQEAGAEDEKRSARPEKSGVRVVRDEDFEVEESYVISDGGTEKGFKLALDEVGVRMPGEKMVLRKLDPPATRETYVKRLGALQGEVMPVLLPEEGEPTIYNRRYVTSSVLVEARDGADRDSVAGKLKLPVEMLPEASPAHVVLKAASPLAALSRVPGMRGVAGVKSAQVLLARQQAKKAMPNDPLVGQQWHLKYQGLPGSVSGTDVNIESVWNYPSTTPGTFYRGSGIRIGIVDDGLQTNHPDFVGNVDTANDWDWNGNDSDPSPGAGDDHGTACAGNAAARGNNGIGVTGTAPLATLVGMRLISDVTTDAQEAAAMGYLNDIIFVKSNSWGPSDDARTLEGPGTLTKNAFNSAVTTGRGGKGTIFLWAGGNGGAATDNSNYDGYANLPETIAIGATDSQNRRASYSEPGANLIVCAPSSGSSPALGITTVDRTGSNGYNTSSTTNGGDYCDDFGGTSSATPTAAGIVALMLERNPNLGWRDVQEILIRSAKRLNNTNSGWTTNGGGFRFHHDYGAGLIDAQAAVTMAGTWTNLTTRTSAVSTQSGLSVTIPNNDSNGITRTFAIAQNVRAEHVTVRLSINHTARGNLEIILTSPTGMASRLAEVHGDTGDNYSNWTFMSARHWGEIASGNWTLKIADRSNTGNTTGGTLTAAELTVFGTPGVPVNPAPVVTITSPADGAVFSPGSTVNVVVNATDLVAGGDQGEVAEVRLYQNNNLVGAKTAPPYTFTVSPSLGSHTLFARAADTEGASADSATVNISLMNQPPVITAATLGDPFGYDDTPVTVSGVAASDPDGTVPVISYQWQSSPDGVNYENAAGLTSATLPASPERSGLKWRCALTPSDGMASGAVFYTNAVNLLDRPVTSVAAGASYSYQSGLVLRGGGSGASRDAIIHEFSQGPSGGTSEWVEILTLRQASFRGWSLSDTAGTRVTFANAAVWDNVPAGTRIVIYNGTSRDPLLPADDTDFSDGSLILPNSNTSYFVAGTWPSLGNNGDGIYLRNAADEVISRVGYGNDSTTGVNIGAVGGGRSAYYAGNTDAGAEVTSNWRVTSSIVARSVKTPRAPGDLFFSEYVEGSSNNKAVELYNPSAGSVDLGSAGYKVEVYANGASGATSTINLSGTIAPRGTFVLTHSAASSALLSYRNQTSGSLTFNGNDAVALKKGTTVVDRIGQVGINPGTAWTGGGLSTEDRTLRRKSSVTTGDMTTGAFDPSVEWDGFPIDTFTGLGSHSSGSVDPAFFLTISPSSFSEAAGASAATGTLTVAAAPSANLVVSLSSSDTSEATVPAQVILLAGETSVTFPVSAVDDSDQDGPQSVTITATATGYSEATFVVTVTDDEVSLEGVTPGQANTPSNLEWIQKLRSGTAGNPALFRLAAGSSLPAGLAIDPETGLISGTVGGAASGSFTVVIERYNPPGETVSQSFVLEVSGAAGFTAWIATYPGLGDVSETGDPDGDGLANLVEYFLGLDPDQRNPGAVAMSWNSAEISLTFTRDPTATGINSRVEWSDTLAAGSWSTAGLTEEILGTTGGLQQVKVSLAITTGDPRKFLRLVVVKP